MKRTLMEQLNICIVTYSPNIIFYNAPLTLKYFCLDLIKEEGRIVDNVVDRKKVLIKLMVLVIIRATTATINTRITITTTIIIVMGMVIIVITMEIVAKAAL